MTQKIIEPNKLGEYISKGKSDFYLKLDKHGDKKINSRKWREVGKPLSPSLSMEGQRFEDEIYERVSKKCDKVVSKWKSHDSQEENNEKLIELFDEATDNNKIIALEQFNISGEIGDFFLPGEVDLIIFWGSNVGLYDIKASWGEKTYHQIQTSTYSILLKRILDKKDCELRTGIIDKETKKNIDFSSIDEVPSFSNEPREDDVRRLLSEDGPISRLYDMDIENIDYQVEGGIKESKYGEIAFTESVESKHIRLLGLTRSEQKAFIKEGYETIEDVADIIEVIEEPKPYQHHEIPIKDKHRNSVRRLVEEHKLSVNIVQLAQKAQSMLGKINPDSSNSFDKPWNLWKHGSGKGNLPEDNPPWENDNIRKDSLIRVYIDVQYDHVKDFISCISSRITSSKVNYSINESEMVDDLVDNSDEQEEYEEEMLSKFFENVFSSISDVADDTGWENEKASVHFYFYTSEDKENLMDACERHQSLNNIRELLSFREGIEQKMYSIIHKEIENRIAPKQLSTGILPMMETSYSNQESMSINDDFEYKDSDGNKINLRKAFKTKMFDYRVPIKRKDDSLEIKYSSYADDFYPLLPRFGSNIPLEYIWSCKEIEKLTPKWADDEGYKSVIESFRWVDSSSKNRRIRKEDIKKMSEKLSQALQHVERSLTYRNIDIEKEPIDLTSNNYLDRSSLSDSCSDYLKMEYQSKKEEALSHYNLPIRERVITGKSIPVEVKEVEVKDRVMKARCETIYGQIGFSNPMDVAEASRIKSDEDDGSGSWLVATPIKKENNLYTEKTERPQEILNSPTVAIQEFKPEKKHVSLISYPSSGKSTDEYREWHKGWTEDGKGSKVEYSISEGDKLILDPQIDSITSQRAKAALSSTSNSNLYNTIEKMRKGRLKKPQTSLFDKEKNREILDWFVENNKPSPNKKQQEFIKSINSKFCLLQGPPGTGKTAGALSLSILSRIYSMSKSTNCLVTGASNKSIKEVMEDVAESMKKYDGDRFSNTSLVRLTGSSPENKIEGVEYVEYNSQEDTLQNVVERLKKENGGQSKLGGSYEVESNIIVFATPSTIHKLADNIEAAFPAQKVYELGFSIFDVLAIDEASMLTLPSFLNAGGLMEEDFQVLISGDQRQMPPVQSHEWLDEDRKNIKEVHPYLSTLDFFRYLRGENIEYMEEKSPHSANLSITRLNTTYRCHEKIADFLKKWVYSKDNINYKSEVSHTLPEPEGTNDIVRKHIMKPENPLVLVLHNDNMSQQSNPLEAEICAEIEKNIPDKQTSGIVTPHNAQKGLLGSKCSEKTNIDTVERFQGGQRDVIMISSTVSDSDYLQKESEFILNPNRLNVALSRMKKKLIVVAPKSLFRMIPNDVEEYERSLIWKGLQKELKVEENEPDWEGKDYELINKNMGKNIEIYKS